MCIPNGSTICWPPLKMHNEIQKRKKTNLRCREKPHKSDKQTKSALFDCLIDFLLNYMYFNISIIWWFFRFKLGISCMANWMRLSVVEFFFLLLSNAQLNRSFVRSYEETKREKKTFRQLCAEWSACENETTLPPNGCCGQKFKFDKNEIMLFTHNLQQFYCACVCVLCV